MLAKAFESSETCSNTSVKKIQSNFLLKGIFSVTSLNFSFLLTFESAKLILFSSISIPKTFLHFLLNSKTFSPLQQPISKTLSLSLISFCQRAIFSSAFFISIFQQSFYLFLCFHKDF
ncbi:hypothetical protein ES703_50594 [subsurface metagenome]